MNDAALVVERADHTIEVDAASDAYAIITAKLHGAVKSLGNLDRGRVHDRLAVALVVTAKGPPTRLDVSATVSTPSDPEASGALAFAGLMSLKKHDPAGFAVLMRRLRDAGLTLTP